jgi:hypothetical protein
MTINKSTEIKKNKINQIKKFSFKINKQKLILEKKLYQCIKLKRMNNIALKNFHYQSKVAFFIYKIKQSNFKIEVLLKLTHRIKN